MPGPVPKRSSERRRRNLPDVSMAIAQSGMPQIGPEHTLEDEAAQHKADPFWSAIVVEWFESLKDSGQSIFYEPSDWAVARYVAEIMNRSLDNKPSGQLITAIFSAMDTLLVTEGARRRARVELERGDKEEVTDPVAAALDLYRQAAK